MNEGSNTSSKPFNFPEDMPLYQRRVIIEKFDLDEKIEKLASIEMYPRLFCPIHNREMLFHEPSKVYACQEPTCMHAHGFLCDWCNCNHGYPFAARCDKELQAIADHHKYNPAEYANVEDM